MTESLEELFLFGEEKMEKPIAENGRIAPNPPLFDGGGRCRFLQFRL